MVGIVVVSHSKKIAEGILALAKEMASTVKIIAAGGMSDGSIGTDAMLISAALEAADDGDGVIVTMDLGSAVLSAEMALDFITDDKLRERIKLADAPVVEGTILAAVQAGLGESVENVLTVAESAWSMRKL